MKSKYVELMELRKLAIKKGKKNEADKLFLKARAMIKAGKVSPEEMQAGAYI
jgi:hypothetical protein